MPPASSPIQRVVDVIVIMGAAVWMDGVASNAMRRRVEGALRTAQSMSQPFFLVSGGVGRNPPSEAEVMRDLLRQAGIPDDHILLEPESTDTVSSVRACARILAQFEGQAQVTVCSDIYHIPRCRWLFRLLGVPTNAGKIDSGRHQNPRLKWLYYYVREVAAFPWDTVVVLAGLGRT